MGRRVAKLGNFGNKLIHDIFSGNLGRSTRYIFLGQREKAVLPSPCDNHLSSLPTSSFVGPLHEQIWSRASVVHSWRFITVIQSASGKTIQYLLDHFDGTNLCQLSFDSRNLCHYMLSADEKSSHRARQSCWNWSLQPLRYLQSFYFHLSVNLGILLCEVEEGNYCLDSEKGRPSWAR